jgi:methyl-accepting chemotaxis protein
MGILGRIRLGKKMAMLLGLLGMAMVVIAGIGAVTLRHRMLDDRVDKLRAMVSSTVATASALEKRVGAQELSRDQAQDLFHRDIRAIRFDGGTGYMSVVDRRTGNVIMHGANPAAEGKPSISKTIAESVQSSDEGLTSYMYPKPGQKEPLPKVTAVGRFQPWDMVIYTGAYTDDLDASFRSSMLATGIAGCAVMLLTMLAAWLISRDITVSLRSLMAAMGRLASGDLTAEVPGSGRRDEVGDMANAVLVFKEHMTAEDRLVATQAVERERAEGEKRSALTAMADKIETETGSALEHMRGLTSAMTTAADAMSASAGRTGSAAGTAASAAGQATATAQSVAGAAEQLSASIREISSQMAQSTAVACRAAAAGSETRATIEALSQEVERIGAVADMIGEIASKTNLLALNATIEAARAGNAGKGFAVVASEVKALATQTARSTQEIGRHIGQVRAATVAAVAAVARIEQTITEVSAIAGSVAAAVEEQGTATAEIARNVTETAMAAREMTSRTEEVSAEAGETCRQASGVRENAAGLDGAMEELRHSVIRAVRVSAAEVDRRNGVRHAADLICPAG